jgi:hypothetical protein
MENLPASICEKEKTGGDPFCVVTIIFPIKSVESLTAKPGPLTWQLHNCTSFSFDKLITSLRWWFTFFPFLLNTKTAQLASWAVG